MERITETISLDKDFPFTIFDGKGFSSKDKAYIHNHYCLEINYVLQGNGTYFIGDEKYPVRKGDVFIINNYEYHYAVNEDGKLQLIVIVFNPDFVWNNEQFDYQYIKAFYEWKDGFKHRLSDEKNEDDEIVKIILEMYSEWSKKETGYKLIIKSLLLKLLALLYRRFENTESFSTKIQNFQSRYNRIVKSVEYIDSNFTDDISLSEIASFSNMNQNYFSEFFHDTMNCTVSEYITNRRVKFACMKLLTSDESITNVAASSGFQNVSYFNRTFKKITGVTPQIYRSEQTRNTKSMHEDVHSKPECQNN